MYQKGILTLVRIYAHLDGWGNRSLLELEQILISSFSLHVFCSVLGSTLTLTGVKGHFELID